MLNNSFAKKSNIQFEQTVLLSTSSTLRAPDPVFSIATQQSFPHTIIMRFTIIIASLLVGIATALPDPTPQGYTGPCSDNNCGVSGKQCSAGRLCVPWPSTDPALRKGCTCSTA